MNRIFRYCLLTVTFILCIGAMAQTTQWRDIYKVKKKDTVFGIARQYGLSLPELMEANPDMGQEGYVLKKGDFIFIPFTKADAAKAAISQPAAKSANAATKTISRPTTTFKGVRVGVMLPLHKIDGDGTRMLEYYRGFLLAVEQLKKEGVSVDIHAWNVPADADIRTTLLKEGANQCDVIFGPLYTTQVPALGEFCKAYGVKMVIPFSINGDEVDKNAQVYQVYQTPTELNEAAISAFLNRFSGAHPVFVDANDTTSKKGSFTFELRKKLETKGIKYAITNLNSSIENFAKGFVRGQQNIIVINSGRVQSLKETFAKLNELNIKYPGLVVSMYGYTEWLMYAPYYMDNFFRYDVYVPSTFYYNASSTKTVELEQAYVTAFKEDMQIALPRFAIIGYDQAQFFIRGIQKYGKKFVGARSQSDYLPIQTPYHFVKTPKGGYRNRNFQLIHYTFNRHIESINF